MKVSGVNLNNNSKSNISMKQHMVIAPPSKAEIFYSEHKAITYSSAVLAAGLGVIYASKGRPVSKLAKSIASSMGKLSDTQVNPNRLSCIMSGEELLKMLPRLKKASYEATADNMKKGVYRADLHSHSNYSDGVGLVKNLLDDATDYADFLYSKTKNKFIYALTDHDTVNGLQEAMTIISGNPVRYKNLDFVPAIEVSFAHSAPKSGNECEVSELLVYGINPYSPKINEFLGKIHQKRSNMLNNFINEAKNINSLAKFSVEEFSKYYEYEKYGNMMNLHWRAYHYVQTKHAVTKYAHNTHQDPEALYRQIMEDSKGASVGMLHDKGKLPMDIGESEDFQSIFKKYAPHFENGKLIAPSENTFEEVIEAFKDEKGIFMAFAHPAYFAERVENPKETLKYFIENSKGLIKASESFHQAYDTRIKPDVVESLQKQTEKLGLLNLGGQDNHKGKLFEITI